MAPYHGYDEVTEEREHDDTTLTVFGFLIAGLLLGFSGLVLIALVFALHGHSL